MTEAAETETEAAETVVTEAVEAESAVAVVRTVLGDIPAGELGVCDAHDHLFLRSPRLAGQELDDVGRAGERLRAFRGLGGRSVVQWTPYGMGRRAADLAALSRSTGAHVVAATGLHQAVHYDEELLRRIGPRPADLFVAELTGGIGTTGVRAGLIKVAGAFHGVDAHARRTMTAAAEAHHRTGAPIAVHLELGTGALDVLDLLCGDSGVDPRRVILGHLGRSPDGVVQREAAAAGRSWRSTVPRGRTMRRTGGCRSSSRRSRTRVSAGSCCSAATRRCPRHPACPICCAGCGPGSNRPWARSC